MGVFAFYLFFFLLLGLAVGFALAGIALLIVGVVRKEKKFIGMASCCFIAAYLILEFQLLRYPYRELLISK